MWRRVVLIGVLLLCPGTLWAQSVPERFLPAGSQIYLRWDGLDKHRKAFDKTAVGKMLNEDTGRFLGALWTWGNELMEVALRQADPKALEMAKEIPPILSTIVHHGFVLGVELNSINPPQGDAVLVFPKSGGAKGAIATVLHKLTDLANVPVKKTKLDKHTVHELGNDQVKFGWWTDAGNDLVMVVGTSSVLERAKGAADPMGGFAQSKSFARFAEFKDYSTWAHGLVDVKGLLNKVGDLSPDAGRLIDELGLKGLESVAFYSGFAGPAERTVIEINTPARKGLLSLINQKTITLADLPPLPADATGFSASNFNLGSLYEGGLTIADAASKVFAGGAIDPRESIKQVEALVGVKFGEDLFGCFDNMSVSYSSPAEGPFGLGSAYLFKVKHEKKLAETLDGLFKSIPPIPFVEIIYKKRAYHGGDIMELRLKVAQGEYPVAILCVHKGWFLYSSLPQAAYGFILRTNGELPVWKADAKLTKALGGFPKEFTAIRVSDPRATVQMLLSIAPLGMTFANSALSNVLPGAPIFDVGLIPHAQEATRHLFPNITITTDDGKKIRTETRASLELPF